MTFWADAYHEKKQQERQQKCPALGSSFLSVAALFSPNFLKKSLLGLGINPLSLHWHKHQSGTEDKCF